MNKIGYNTFLSFYSDIHDKVYVDRFESCLRFYSLLWSESPDSFALSFKSYDCNFDPDFIHDLIDVLPNIKRSILTINDKCIVLVLLFYRI